ncbi:MAG TPA: hypothetical protein VGM92_08940 [Candidatus Kapabacteria bacterium]|jgi:photosystem II stability/assembly factor-like uncharacterized protein
MKQAKTFFIAAIAWVAAMTLIPEFAAAQWVKLGFGASAMNIFANRLYAQAGTGNIMYTMDGINWIQLPAPIPNDRVTSSASLGNTMAIGFFYNGVFLSTDSGGSWHPCSVDSTFGFIPSIQAITQYQGYLFAGTNDFDIFRSPDSGKHWDTVVNPAHTLSLGFWRALFPVLR